MPAWADEIPTSSVAGVQGKYEVLIGETKFKTAIRQKLQTSLRQWRVS
jgi:hypothetical protein